MMKKLFMLLFIITITIFPYLEVNAVNVEKFNTYSNNIIVYNLEENKIMYQKNEDEKASIASLTKVMSALVILENTNNLNKKIDFQKVDFNFLRQEDLSVSTLDINKTYTYKDFLYSFILESSADCGYALVLDTTDSVDEFVNLMNKKAQEIGMKNTRFSNPVGLDDVNNYSTMEDMLKLMKYSLNNKTLNKIMSTFTYTTSNNDKINHTILGYMTKFKLDMPYLKGGKTGYNDDPGYALMSYAKKNNSTYIIVSTNASYDRNNPKHLKDAKKLYEYYFSNYGYQKIIEKNDTILSLKTKYLKESKIDIKAPKDVLYFLKNNYDKNDITPKYKGINTITPKNKKGDKLGTLEIYYQDNWVDTLDITLEKDVHFSIIKFLETNKYLIIASITYITIIILTIVITKKIKNKK